MMMIGRAPGAAIEGGGELGWVEGWWWYWRTIEVVDGR